MTVTTPPPCTTEIPSVESEWAVIGGVGRGVHCHLCVRIEQCRKSVCTCRCFVGSPLLHNFFSLFGERNAPHQCSSSSLT